MTDAKAVEFEAEIRQVKTMADGSVNVIFNLPEYCMDQAIEIMKHVKELVKCLAEFED